MPTDRPRHLDLRLELADDEVVEDLERALLRARATELSDVKRRNIRLTAGYGDVTARDVMDDEARRAQRRHDALTLLLDAIRTARSGGGKPGLSS